MPPMQQLYSFWRSSASYRVRIGLSLKGLKYEYRPIHLVKDGGQQFRAEYLTLNPQARVPLLVDGGLRLGQSLAILDLCQDQKRLEATPVHEFVDLFVV